jgi:hypothetical protein
MPSAFVEYAMPTVDELFAANVIGEPMAGRPRFDGNCYRVMALIVRRGCEVADTDAYELEERRDVHALCGPSGEDCRISDP